MMIIVSGLMSSQVCSKTNLPTSAKKKCKPNQIATTTRGFNKGHLALTAIHQDETRDDTQTIDGTYCAIVRAKTGFETLKFKVEIFPLFCLIHRNFRYPGRVRHGGGVATKRSAAALLLL